MKFLMQKARTRRHPVHIAGADPAAIDPDLPAAQDPVDMAFRDPFQPAHQVVVDALADRIFVNRLP